MSEEGHRYTFSGFPGPYWEAKARRESVNTPETKGPDGMVDSSEVEGEGPPDDKEMRNES